LLLRTFFCWLYIGIPGIIVMLGYGIWVMLLSVGQFFYGIFTGKQSKRFFDASMNMNNLSARVSASLSNLVDGYPSLSPSFRAENVKVEAEYDPAPGRKRYLVRYFFGMFLLIPHFFVLYLKTAISGFMQILAFFYVLFTKEFPAGMHDFIVDTNRESVETSFYMMAMQKEYPKF
jgi:hypothetical protein